MVVDFPEPFGPRKPATCPVRTVRSSLSRAWKRPKYLSTPWASMTGVDDMVGFPLHGWGGVCVGCAAFPLGRLADVQEVGVEHRACGEQALGEILPRREEHLLRTHAHAAAKGGVPPR